MLFDLYAIASGLEFIILHGQGILLQGHWPFIKACRIIKQLNNSLLHAIMPKALPAAITWDFVCNSLKEVQA